MNNPTLFVFSPALYPNTPLSGKNVFTHGNIIETKNRNGELVVRVKDEKGEWEGYAEEKKTPMLNVGTHVRAYGSINAQPDGRNMLACTWIKEISTEEKEYCERKTRHEWGALTQTNATLSTIQPHIMPAPKLVKTETIVTHAQPKENEFISAAEFKVEREYL
ncbi:MAG: hypothetical protein FJY86_03000 [Candidatus Diapherotrites archaeon]|uniref:Uncharacterized protein n=1 Tax=Candidatus Iainarchaeum sp. TaxID=3101447 RepID=A0A8T4C6U0_9ARCH|nr:hypothetical protein [Candidatus Diapherotrites archaeon]